MESARTDKFIQIHLGSRLLLGPPRCSWMGSQFLDEGFSVVGQKQLGRPCSKQDGHPGVGMGALPGWENLGTTVKTQMPPQAGNTWSCILSPQHEVTR
jgi:hypothetical protein